MKWHSLGSFSIIWQQKKAHRNSIQYNDHLLLYANLHSTVLNYVMLFGAAVNVYAITLPGGVFCGVRRQWSRWHNICMCAISVIGVIFLKRTLMFSRQEGMYLSKSITRLDFSVEFTRVSSQLVTYLKHQNMRLKT